MISRWLPLCARAGPAAKVRAKASAPNAKAASAAVVGPARLAEKNAPGNPGAFCLDDVSLFSDASVRERIRANLDLVDLGPVLRAAFVVEHGARARHRP